MISVKMDFESKLWVSSQRQKGVYPVMKDSAKSSDEGNTTERDMFVRKDYNPGVW